MLHINKPIGEEGRNSRKGKGLDWMRRSRGGRTEGESDKKVKASRLFRPCGLVPPGIAQHSVKILHFKINHSRLGTNRKTHTYTLTWANKGIFTQPLTGCLPSSSGFNKAASACHGSAWKWTVVMWIDCHGRGQYVGPLTTATFKKTCQVAIELCYMTHWHVDYIYVMSWTGAGTLSHICQGVKRLEKAVV